MTEEQQTLGLGDKVKIDELDYLVVRYVDSVTLFEEPTTSTVWIEKESYLELRNEAGEVRFKQLTVERTESKRTPGKIKGIKPYFWKVGSNGSQQS